MRAREEARAQGHEWDDGSFDPSDLYDSGASIADIARIRADMKAEYPSRASRGARAASADDEVPDTIIEKRPNIDPFKEDPENYRLRSIEHYDDQTGEAKKGRVFFESVIAREEEPDIKNATDALFHVLNKSGRVDLDEIAQAGRDVAGRRCNGPCRAGVPQSRHEGVGALDRISRRQRPPEARCRRARRSERPALPGERRRAGGRHAARARQVRRARRARHAVDPGERRQAVRDRGARAQPLPASYQPRLATWSVSGDKAAPRRRRPSAPPAACDGADRRRPQRLDAQDLRHLQATRTATRTASSTRRRRRPPRTSRRRSRRSSRTGCSATTTRRAPAQDLQRALQLVRRAGVEWRLSDHARRHLVLEVAPAPEARHRPHRPERQHLPRPRGRRGQDGDDDLGVMEMRRLGLVNKPMIAVPNHMLGQFTKEFYELYPLAKLMIADEENFHTDKRKQFVSDVALNDLDAVIITHSAFGLIPMSQSSSSASCRTSWRAPRHALEIKASDEDQQTKNITRRKVEQSIEQAEQRLRASPPAAATRPSPSSSWRRPLTSTRRTCSGSSTSRPAAGTSRASTPTARCARWTST
jgi:hypothetical protein